MASATGREERPVHGGKGTSWLGKVFELNPAAINWPRAVMALDVMLAPLVVFWAIGHEEYLLSAIFGVLFTALAVLWTLCGMAIGVLMLLVRRTAKAPPQPAAQPA